MHRRLIAEAKKTHQELTKLGIVIKCGCSKVHSKPEWNEIADELANEGRTTAEVGPQEGTRPRRRKTPVLQLHQFVDAIAVRKATSEKKHMEVANRWARQMTPCGDVTAIVSTNSVRNNPCVR